MNCQFEIFEDNIFIAHSGVDTYPILKDNKRATDGISRQLLSVCSVLTEKPFIQIHGKSKLCSNIAKELLEQLNNLYKMPGASENAIVESQINADEEVSSVVAAASFNKQRATLLIVERSIDLASIFAHDYCYGSLLFDQKDAANLIE